MKAILHGLTLGDRHEEEARDLLEVRPSFDRGAPPLDAEAVVDVILAITSMSRELPEICELDLNPVLVAPSSVCVLDARIRVGSHAAVFERGARSLSTARRQL